MQRRMWGIVSVVGMSAAVLITLGLAFRALPVQARPAQGNSGQQIRVMFQETATPVVSVTPTNTITPSRTKTQTATASATVTAVPVCSLVTLDSARLIDTYLEIRVRNGNETAPVFITRAEVQWSKPAAFPGLYADEMRIVGRSRFWFGPDYNPPTTADTTDPNWNDDIPSYLLRRFDGGPTITTVRVRFSNGPTMLSDYMTLGDFRGTRLYFSTTWGGLTFNPANDCMIEITTPATGTPTPSLTPITYTPTPSPTANCTNFSVHHLTFETNGVVSFSLTNNDTTPVHITGFHINWNTYYRIRPYITPLDFVSVGEKGAFDPTSVVVWDGNATVSPFEAASGSPDWRTNPVILPGTTTKIWFDFDGTAGPIDLYLGYNAYDFNDSWFTLSGDCDPQLPDQPTVAPTSTVTITLTPSRTLSQTPTTSAIPTFTPSIVLTPSNTFTPSPTFTPTRTITPTLPPSWTPFPATLTLAASLTPSVTPVLSCADYELEFAGWFPNGIVGFFLHVHGSIPASVSGFHLNWAHDPSPQPLIRAFTRGGAPGSWANFPFWAGWDTESPTTASSTGGEGDWNWFISTYLDANETHYLWFDFHGTELYLNDLGYTAEDFAGSSVTLNTQCVVVLGQHPEPTFTPSPTFTLSKTPPPSQTPVPTETRTPTRTRTPTATRTPSPTVIPSATRTDIPNYTLIPGCISYGESSTIICGAQ